VVKSDGSIWFTDPRFGILGNYEGQIGESELPMNVYRADWRTGVGTAVADGINAPNGLCFSPDESGCTSSNRAASRGASSFTTSSAPARNLRTAKPDRFRAARHARQLALRHRGQSVVRLGHVGGP
jgi:hypothetical protein